MVREARAFAWRELGCLTTRATPRYADLKRDFVVWSVVATPEFSVVPREWCFPIVGCVAYRGYFRKDSAEAFAETLRSEGLDAIVGGVPAYSTLGKFNDPDPEHHDDYGDDELASIMFHELSHQLVYIQDDTSFNEAFAVTVEQEGLARWLKFRGREADLDQYRKRRARQAEGLALVAQFRGELSALYGMTFQPEVMRARKTRCLLALVSELRALAAVRHRVAPGRRARRQAQQCAARFPRHLLRLRAGVRTPAGREQHDLPRFYAAARALAKMPREERRQPPLCEWGPPK